jgi:predicted nuclease with TOPRIM domain
MEFKTCEEYVLSEFLGLQEKYEDLKELYEKSEQENQGLSLSLEMYKHENEQLRDFIKGRFKGGEL